MSGSSRSQSHGFLRVIHQLRFLKESRPPGKE
jgi:hypothetical protein